MEKDEIKKNNENTCCKDELISKKESLEKLKLTSKNIAKSIDVFRIIFIVGAILCIVCSVMCMVAGYCGWLTTLYEKYPSKMGKLDIDLNKQSIGVFIENLGGEATLEKIYQTNNLDKLCYGMGITCLTGVVDFAVAFAVTFLLKPLFVKLSNDETPFTKEMAKKIKVAFIIITILVIIHDLFIGILTGGLLTCFYFIFLYGCGLQKEEDETL